MTEALPLDWEESPEFDTGLDCDGTVDEVVREIEGLILERQADTDNATLGPDNKVFKTKDSFGEYWGSEFTLLVNALSEAQSMDAPRSVRGPLHKDLNVILARCTQLLESWDPSFTAEILAPWPYQTKQSRDITSRWCIGSPEMRVLNNLKRAKRGAIDELIDSKMDGLAMQEIPEGVLGVPVYISQAFATACVSATALMVMEEIYGTRFDNNLLEQAMMLVHSEERADDVQVLNLMRSELLKQKFEKEVFILEFTGADPDFVSRIVSLVRKNRPDNQVFCIVSVLSDSTANSNAMGIWHSNVLLEIDDEHVWVHDPARVKHRNGNRRAIRKADFFRRWGQAYMRGHIIAG